MSLATRSHHNWRRSGQRATRGAGWAMPWTRRDLIPPTVRQGTLSWPFLLQLALREFCHAR